MKKSNLKAQKNLQLKLVFARFHKLITAVLVVLVLIGGYYLILEPQYRGVGKQTPDLAEVQVDLLNRKQHFEELKILVDNFNKIKPEEVEKMKSILPRHKDIAGLFVQFQDIALKNNLN